MAIVLPDLKALFSKDKLIWQTLLIIHATIRHFQERQIQSTKVKQKPPAKLNDFLIVLNLDLYMNTAKD